MSRNSYPHVHAWMKAVYLASYTVAEEQGHSEEEHFVEEYIEEEYEAEEHEEHFE